MFKNSGKLVHTLLPIKKVVKSGQFWAILVLSLIILYLINFLLGVTFDRSTIWHKSTRQNWHLKLLNVDDVCLPHLKSIKFSLPHISPQHHNFRLRYRLHPVRNLPCDRGHVHYVSLSSLKSKPPRIIEHFQMNKICIKELYYHKKTWHDYQPWTYKQKSTNIYSTEQQSL